MSEKFAQSYYYQQLTEVDVSREDMFMERLQRLHSEAMVRGVQFALRYLHINTDWNVNRTFITYHF